MKTSKLNLKSASLLLAFVVKSLVLSSQNTTVQHILTQYVEDYQKDVALTKDVVFGIQVDTVFWHVSAKARTVDAPASVALIKGRPNTPTYYFKTNLETLTKINKGEINALTASAKNFSTDAAPFDVDTMEGFQPNATFVNDLFSVYFHFWTRGFPERIPFGLEYTRFTHGGQASVFYYQEGFRSAYFALKKGQHANKDERSRHNPFPSLFVAIKGQGTMIINGTASLLSAGEAILIPADVSHEFYNENEAPFEGFLFMFGEGA
ncbi:MAG: cupin domain-containing protein [Bacteroidota bacterium]